MRQYVARSANRRCGRGRSCCLMKARQLAVVAAVGAVIGGLQPGGAVSGPSSPPPPPPVQGLNWSRWLHLHILRTFRGVVSLFDGVRSECPFIASARQTGHSSSKRPTNRQLGPPRIRPPPSPSPSPSPSPAPQLSTVLDQVDPEAKERGRRILYVPTAPPPPRHPPTPVQPCQGPSEIVCHGPQQSPCCCWTAVVFPEP